MSISIFSKLQPDFTFETFVEGPDSRQAIEIARVVGSSADNPLVIFGGAGVGKTHLLHAIGHRVFAECPDRPRVVIDVTVDPTEILDRTFPNEAGLLLFDGIDAVRGNPELQERLGHLLPRLLDQGWKVVATSRVFPRHLDTDDVRLELIECLLSGLVVKLEPLDRTARCVFLERLGERFRVTLEPETLYLLSVFGGSNMKTLIAIMEGLSRLNTTEPIVPSVLRRYGEMFNLSEPVFQKDQRKGVELLHALCGLFSISVEELREQNNKASVVRKRHFIMWALRSSGMSFPAIGKLLSRDHSSVLHAVNKIEAKAQGNPEFARQLQEFSRHVIQGKRFTRSLLISA